MLENADPHALARPEEFHAGDPVLLCLLGGAVPADAERLAVEGSGEDGHVWTQGGDLLLVTRAYLLSPGPPAALSRFENAADRSWAWRIHEILLETFIASFETPPEELILDFDATDDAVHGKQEGRLFHGYYDHYCFLPLYVFCGDRQACLGAAVAVGQKAPPGPGPGCGSSFAAIAASAVTGCSAGAIARASVTSSAWPRTRGQDR